MEILKKLLSVDKFRGEILANLKMRPEWYQEAVISLIRDKKMKASFQEFLVTNAADVHDYTEGVVSKETAEFLNDFRKFRDLARGTKKRFRVNFKDHQAYLSDKSKVIGFDRHYIYHPVWAAQILASERPKRHVDISSTLIFPGMLSAFFPVTHYEFRKIPLVLRNLKIGQINLVKLPFRAGSMASLSCLHTLEHIGLGRYGDRLDPDGDLKAVRELSRVLAPGGTLLVVVPVGKKKLIFNAHRIYRAKEFRNYFKNLELRSFDLIREENSDGGIIYGAKLTAADKENYACGCFHFRKNS